MHMRGYPGLPPTRLFPPRGCPQAEVGAAAQIQEIVGRVPPQNWASNSTLQSALAALGARWRAKRDDPSRELLGANQLSWLEAAVDDAASNSAAGAASLWQLIGNQIIVQPRRLDLAAAANAAGDAVWRDTLHNLTFDGAVATGATVLWHDRNAFAAPLLGRPQPVTPSIQGQARALLAQGAFADLDPDFDGWAGYPPARKRFLDALARVGHGRVAVYAGDSHAAWAGHLVSDAGEHVALEFDGTSVTSSGPDTWLAFVPPALLAEGYVGATPTLECARNRTHCERTSRPAPAVTPRSAPAPLSTRYAETQMRGWLDVSLTREAHTVRFRTVSTVGSPEFTSGCDVAFLQSTASPHLMERVPCTVGGSTEGGSAADTAWSVSVRLRGLSSPHAS